MTTALVISTRITPVGHEATVSHCGKAVIAVRRATSDAALAVALIQTGIEVREGKLSLEQPPHSPRRRTDNRELAASLRALAEEIEGRVVTP